LASILAQQGGGDELSDDRGQIIEKQLAKARTL
jgi:hypothetical protein